MKPKGYCPECGKPTNNIEYRQYALFTMWILDCRKCGKWEIQAKK